MKRVAIYARVWTGRSDRRKTAERELRHILDRAQLGDRRGVQRCQHYWNKDEGLPHSTHFRTVPLAQLVMVAAS